jgi:hypothetical protein
MTPETATGFQVLSGIVATIYIVFGPYHRWRESKSRVSSSAPPRKWLQIADRIAFILLAIVLMRIFVVFVTPDPPPAPIPKQQDTPITTPPPGGASGTGATTPKPPPQTIRLSPPPCDIPADAAAIPFYVSATIIGSSEISADKIEKSIESHLPSPDFYPSKRPECAALHIDAKIDVVVSTEKVSSAVEFTYTSMKNGKTEIIKSNCYNYILVRPYNPIWSQESAILNSIYDNMTDDRLVKFIQSDFNTKFIAPISGERPTSQCVAG